MDGERHDGRTILAIGGADRLDFLQGLVTNDVARSGLVYAALLSPQGKYLADFFLLTQDDRILLDVSSGLVPDLIKRLKMYKLRADVTLEEFDLYAQRGLGPIPNDGYADPRHPALGWRRYVTSPGTEPVTDWEALRVAHCIPESGIELVPNETYVLEAGFERLAGVDFRKGCYVGQEVTARMKHKTELRKGLTIVTVDGAAELGTEITTEGKSAGRLFTRTGDRAIAFLRFDRAKGGMRAGDASVRLAESPAES
ncbi:MAG: folate-binding protein [Pseudomonadota bacterium]